MTKYFTPIAIVLAGAAIAGAIIYTQSGQKEEATEKVSLDVTGGDHIRGNPEAPVTLVEFSDFQCPYCQSFHSTIQRVLADYPDSVRWVYKHFPLDSIHPQARPAAEAAECASEQGKFWEFADGLFENQSIIGRDLYSQLASEFSLDVAQFEDCVSSKKYRDRVEADFQEGVKLGVRGTPNSFLNGGSIPGAVSYETLKAETEKALKEI